MAYGRIYSEMKTIYFVRHGVTNQGESNFNQMDNEPLSEKGRQQAKAIGKRFESIKIDKVVTSPMERAMETAKEIATEIEISPLFAEIRKPKNLIGRSKDEPEVGEILGKIEEMILKDPGWHYDDEENFFDVKDRGLEALEYLENLDEENVVVVAHARMITILVGLMMFGKEFSPELLVKFKSFFRMGNTGITVCNLNEGKWKLFCWNDRSHWME